MLKYFSTLIILLISFSACGGSRSSVDKLNGTWTNPLMTISYDVKKEKTIITALGETEEKKFKIVKVDGAFITFMSGDEEITAQFSNDDTMILSKKGGIPVTMQRKK